MPSNNYVHVLFGLTHWQSCLSLKLTDLAQFFFHLRYLFIRLSYWFPFVFCNFQLISPLPTTFNLFPFSSFKVLPVFSTPLICLFLQQFIFLSLFLFIVLIFSRLYSSRLQYKYYFFYTYIFLLILISCSSLSYNFCLPHNFLSLSSPLLFCSLQFSFQFISIFFHFLPSVYMSLSINPLDFLQLSCLPTTVDLYHFLHFCFPIYPLPQLLPFLVLFIFFLPRCPTFDTPSSILLIYQNFSILSHSSHYFLILSVGSSSWLPSTVPFTLSDVLIRTTYRYQEFGGSGGLHRRSLPQCHRRLLESLRIFRKGKSVCLLLFTLWKDRA